MLSLACAPPADARNPVITSSNISRLPYFVHISRRDFRNPSFGAISPTLAGYGSSMTHAILSEYFEKHSSTAEMSLNGRTSVSFARSAGTPPSWDCRKSAPRCRLLRAGCQHARGSSRRTSQSYPCQCILWRGGLRTSSPPCLSLSCAPFPRRVSSSILIAPFQVRLRTGFRMKFRF